MTKTERTDVIYNDYLSNRILPQTTYRPCKRMRYWIKQGRYEVAGDLCNEDHITIHFSEATLLAVYTSHLSRDVNIYKTCKRKSKPFIIFPTSSSSAYCWRVPVTIHGN